MNDNKIDLVNISAIQSIVESIHQDGDAVIMSEEANRQIANFKKARQLMDKAEDILKESIVNALEPFNSQSIKGRYATISTVKARMPAMKYKVIGNDNEFIKEKIVLVPDDDKIDEYIIANNALPIGVVENKPGKASLSIRLKNNQVDDEQ